MGRFLAPEPCSPPTLPLDDLLLPNDDEKGGGLTEEKTMIGPVEGDNVERIEKTKNPNGGFIGVPTFFREFTSSLM